ncbi:hypothetical protein [Nocardia barduliensis]|uniref:hypothetical protein n=1 Tax=Nocardia barduliensis TaxID=2736643 RepID=UPI0015738BC5|nr:hypothetical protein [Nocardia barduliensis]
MTVQSLLVSYSIVDHRHHLGVVPSLRHRRGLADSDVLVDTSSPMLFASDSHGLSRPGTFSYRMASLLRRLPPVAQPEAQHAGEDDRSGPWDGYEKKRRTKQPSSIHATLTTEHSSPPNKPPPR